MKDIGKKSLQREAGIQPRIGRDGREKATESLSFVYKLHVEKYLLLFRST